MIEKEHLDFLKVLYQNCFKNGWWANLSENEIKERSGIENYEYVFRTLLENRIITHVGLGMGFKINSLGISIFEMNNFNNDLVRKNIDVRIKILNFLYEEYKKDPNIYFNEEPARIIKIKPGHFLMYFINEIFY